MRKPITLLAMLFVLLFAAMAAAPLLEQPPALRTHNPLGQFDAARAKARLTFILGDERPHPADSEADDEVRARLVATLRRMGLQPIVRDQFACNALFKARGVSCARVRNVVAVLGPKTGKALLLNAHYDSVPAGPGASDDGIGVATLLEIGAMLKQQPLKRPVILLFNEGEELGLVGARAFLEDALSRNVDSLINLEARGVRGPVNMFETSRPNAAPVALFAAVVKHPAANSLSTDVYRLMPNYTDVNSFAERGWLTLNFAPVGNETRYHSHGDDLAALDSATLQHMGDQTLALAQALTSGTPPQTAGDRIFMDLSGRALVSLPMTAGVILLTLLLLGFAVAMLKRGAGGRGTALVLGTMIGSGLLVWIAVTLIGVVRPGMFWRAHPLWTNLAAYACVLLNGTFLLASIGRSASVRQLRASFWMLFLAIRRRHRALRARRNRLLPLPAADRRRRNDREPLVAPRRAGRQPARDPGPLFHLGRNAGAAARAAERWSDVGVRAARRASAPAGADRSEAAHRSGRSTRRDGPCGGRRLTRLGGCRSGSGLLRGPPAALRHPAHH